MAVGSNNGNLAPGFTLAAASTASTSSALGEESSLTSNEASGLTCTLENHDWVEVWQRLLEYRFCKHNKDLRLICQDGGAQIDAILLMPFVQGTSFLGQELALMGHRSSNSPSTGSYDMSQTVILLPDIHLYEVHQMMTLLHEVCKYLGFNSLCSFH